MTRVTIAEQDAAREQLLDLGVRCGGRPIRCELWQRALRKRLKAARERRARPERLARRIGAVAL